MDIEFIVAFVIVFYILKEILVLINFDKGISPKYKNQALLIAIGIVVAVTIYSVTTQYSLIYTIDSYVVTLLLCICCLFGLNVICEIHIESNILVGIMYYLSIASLVIFLSILHIYFAQWALVTWYYPADFNTSTYQHMSLMILSSMCIYGCCLRLFI
jgi:hypothetical protein